MVTAMSPKVIIWDRGERITSFSRFHMKDGKVTDKESVDFLSFKKVNVDSWTLFTCEELPDGGLKATLRPTPVMPMKQSTVPSVHVDDPKIQERFSGIKVSVVPEDRDTLIEGLVRDNAELREIVATLRTMVRKEAESAGIVEDTTVCFFCGKILTPEDNRTSGGSIHAYCRKCHGKVFASIGAK